MDSRALESSYIAIAQYVAQHITEEFYCNKICHINISLVQEEFSYIAFNKVDEDEINETLIERKYELPDGQIITIGTAIKSENFFISHALGFNAHSTKAFCAH